MRDWLLVVWNSRPGVLLTSEGMMELENLATITGTSTNTDLVVIPWGVTS
jgi:hypothetical protein